MKFKQLDYEYSIALSRYLILEAEKVSVLTATQELNQIPDSECACGHCQSMCAHVPCWPTPDEAKALIDKGYGDRLMNNYWVIGRDEPDTHVLCPAITGKEGQHAPFDPRGACTFFKAGKCELHDLGLKPAEGRKTLHSDTDPKVRKLVADAWKNEEAQAMAESWVLQHQLPAERTISDLLFEMLDGVITIEISGGAA